MKMIIKVPNNSVSHVDGKNTFTKIILKLPV